MIEIRNDGVKIIPKIKSASITNEGVIKKADIQFKNGLNIIVGRCGSGKTTVLKAIEKAMHGATENVAVELDNAEFSITKINNLSMGNKLMLLMFGIANASLDSCFLIDNLMGYADTEIRVRILKELSKSNNQIILTMVNLPAHLKIKANIIHTKDFLKR